ncbi:chaperonin 10-like protein [Plectosphaerella plurivora]|uniref:Chaperonin 10-like protein n=1 Tax=Plectosphaerella plurivora TaxID=936078 RepID=A0A9P8V3V0_9PEZI|nr:chaperonin 10-like protein [Plectosphaerella plurivora]
MATQTGITVAEVNAPFTIVSDIARPTPGPGQVLLKTLAVGINPIEHMQQHTGMLVQEWPAILGSDCAGVVVEVGPDCKRLKPGNIVFSSAPVGQNKLTPFQETFLADERVYLKKPDNMSVEESATMGVGLLTAALGLLAGGKLDLPEVGATTKEKNEWVVVLGGSGCVGQYGVQLARLNGYKVLASCSPSRKSVALQGGATDTFNGRAGVDEQVADIKRITGGNFARVFDATTFGTDVMIKALDTVSTAETKYLSSVDDWTEFKVPASIKEYRVSAGHVCREDEALGAEVTRDIASWVPGLEAHVAAGTLRPVEYQLSNVAGWEGVIQGIQDVEAGRAPKKIVVRVQDA